MLFITNSIWETQEYFNAIGVLEDAGKFALCRCAMMMWPLTSPLKYTIAAATLQTINAAAPETPVSLQTQFNSLPSLISYGLRGRGCVCAFRLISRVKRSLICAHISICVFSCFTRIIINSHMSILFMTTHSHTFVSVLLDFCNLPVMQLSSIRSKLIGLLLSAVPLSLSLVIGDSTSIGTGLLTLLDTQNLSPFSGSPSAHCKDPDDPYPFVNSLNHTLPILPNISTSFLESVGINPEEKSYPFDCEIALPGGYISFEVC